MKKKKLKKPLSFEEFLMKEKKFIPIEKAINEAKKKWKKPK